MFRGRLVAKALTADGMTRATARHAVQWDQSRIGANSVNQTSKSITKGPTAGLLYVGLMAGLAITFGGAHVQAASADRRATPRGPLYARKPTWAL